MKNGFAYRLNVALDATCMTQTELSIKTGIDRDHINHIVRGRRKPRMEILEKLLVALPHIDARWLITGVKK